MTRLSVALCTYNGATFVGEQLGSIAAQSRQPDEVIVRDDASTDDTLAIVRAFASRAPFPVTVIEGERNVGYVKNFEAAIQACTGDLVALSDQDDVWLPHKLARLEAALAADPEALLAFSDATLVDGALRPLGGTVWESLAFTPREKRRVAAGGGDSTLLSRPLVTGATVCFRSSLVGLSLPFPVEDWHDAWLGLVATLHGRLALVDEPLILYRQHANNAIGASIDPSSFLKDVVGDLRWRRALRAGSGDPQAWLPGKVGDLLRTVRRALRDTLPPEMDAVVLEAERFLAFRADLPAYPRRAVDVATHLAKGRYSRFAIGVRSAVRDLIR